MARSREELLLGQAQDFALTLILQQAAAFANEINTYAGNVADLLDSISIIIEKKAKNKQEEIAKIKTIYEKLNEISALLVKVLDHNRKAKEFEEQHQQISNDHITSQATLLAESLVEAKKNIIKFIEEKIKSHQIQNEELPKYIIEYLTKEREEEELKLERKQLEEEQNNLKVIREILTQLEQDPSKVHDASCDDNLKKLSNAAINLSLLYSSDERYDASKTFLLNFDDAKFYFLSQIRYYILQIHLQGQEKDYDKIKTILEEIKDYYFLDKDKLSIFIESITLCENQYPQQKERIKKYHNSNINLIYSLGCYEVANHLFQKSKQAEGENKRQILNETRDFLERLEGKNNPCYIKSPSDRAKQFSNLKQLRQKFYGEFFELVKNDENIDLDLLKKCAEEFGIIEAKIKFGKEILKNPNNFGYKNEQTATDEAVRFIGVENLNDEEKFSIATNEKIDKEKRINFFEKISEGFINAKKQDQESQEKLQNIYFLLYQNKTGKTKAKILKIGAELGHEKMQEDYVLELLKKDNLSEEEREFILNYANKIEEKTTKTKENNFILAICAARNIAENQETTKVLEYFKNATDSSEKDKYLKKYLGKLLTTENWLDLKIDENIARNSDEIKLISQYKKQNFKEFIKTAKNILDQKPETDFAEKIKEKVIEIIPNFKDKNERKEIKKEWQGILQEKVAVMMHGDQSFDFLLTANLFQNSQARFKLSKIFLDSLEAPNVDVNKYVETQKPTSLYKEDKKILTGIRDEFFHAVKFLALIAQNDEKQRPEAISKLQEIFEKKEKTKINDYHDSTKSQEYGWLELIMEDAKKLFPEEFRKEPKKEVETATAKGVASPEEKYKLH